MLLPKTLLKFRETDPKVHVQVLEISSSEQHAQELIAHRTDVAFVRTAQEDEYIKSELLHRQLSMQKLALNVFIFLCCSDKSYVGPMCDQFLSVLFRGGNLQNLHMNFWISFTKFE